MNLVERWFSALTTKKSQRSTQHDSVNALAADIIERLGRYCADLTNTELSDETT